MNNKIIFVNGKSNCGCVMEFSDGGGEYSDVHHITLCAAHDKQALLDELEADKEQIKTLESRNRRLEGIVDAAEKRIAELEEKLAKPVLLPKTNGYWTEQEKVYEEAITLAKRQIRLAGFRCEEDE